ncbi:LysM domain-containing protein [Nocardioides sp.]|uniref:LysM peptidoglycan-binding domain-containing protein n=1 Tax=Nocardioides sp. TaxID=35761 RepID=UPI003512E7A4
MTLHPRTRSVLVGLAATLVTAATLAATMPAALRGHTPTDFTAALDRAALLALGGTACWGWLIVVDVVRSVWRDTPPPPRVPGWVRRPLLALCGVALVTAATAVPATAVPSHGAGAVAAAGEAIAAAVRTGPATASAVPAAAADPVDPARHHRVHRGESLWRIAEQLEPGAEDADLVARVADLYALNHDVIGSDPDLLRPGQRLELP